MTKKGHKKKIKKVVTNVWKRFGIQNFPRVKELRIWNSHSQETCFGSWKKNFFSWPPTEISAPTDPQKMTIFFKISGVFAEISTYSKEVAQLQKILHVFKDLLMYLLPHKYHYQATNSTGKIWEIGLGLKISPFKLSWAEG